MCDHFSKNGLFEITTLLIVGDKFLIRADYCNDSAGRHFRVYLLGKF